MILQRFIEELKFTLAGTSLLPIAVGLWRKMMILTDPAFRRREHELRQEFVQFKEECGSALAHKLSKRPRGNALVVSLGFVG